MWDMIVSVPDHCLSFYFEKVAKQTTKFIHMLTVFCYFYRGPWFACYLTACRSLIDCVHS